MLIAAVLAVSVPLVAWGILLALSPGRPASVVGKDGKPVPGSIAEKIYVDVNGVEQGMFIIGRDARNPVLLVLHGGMPEYFLADRHPTGLEDLFTVAWWEQRGSGMSYRDDIPRGSITPEQLIADTVAVSHYLRRRFAKETIYLMAHSGGTFFGIQAAARHPELYAAYVGVAQIACQVRSEKLAYEHMLQAWRAAGNRRMVRALEAAPVTLEGGTPRQYLAVRDKAMHRLGIGTFRRMRSIVAGLFLPTLAFRGYTLAEKVRFWRGKARNGVSVIWEKSLFADMGRLVPELKIPAYFLEGIHDHTCNYGLAREYFSRLQAPVRGFYSFQDSAHCPHFEEPEKTRRIMREDVLMGRNGLADLR
jgi:pimeloyl-ACP methyl ester carboxylesterase